MPCGAVGWCSFYITVSLFRTARSSGELVLRDVAAVRSVRVFPLHFVLLVFLFY